MSRTDQTSLLSLELIDWSIDRSKGSFKKEHRNHGSGPSLFPPAFATKQAKQTAEWGCRLLTYFLAYLLACLFACGERKKEKRKRGTLNRRRKPRKKEQLFDWYMSNQLDVLFVCFGHDFYLSVCLSVCLSVYIIFGSNFPFLSKIDVSPEREFFIPRKPAWLLRWCRWSERERESFWRFWLDLTGAVMIWWMDGWMDGYLEFLKRGIGE